MEELEKKPPVARARWTEDEKSLASLMHGMGIHYRHIAAATGRTPGTVICRISRKKIVADHDVERLDLAAGDGRPWTEDEETLLGILSDRGLQAVMAARMLNRSREAVEAHKKLLGIDDEASLPKAAIALRRCIRCRREFRSQGPQHRICTACRDDVG